MFPSAIVNCYINKSNLVEDLVADVIFFADMHVSSAELECVNASVLDETSGPVGARFLSSIALEFGTLIHREETKGRFRKRVGFGECALVPGFSTGEHLNVPSFLFLVPGNIR